MGRTRFRLLLAALLLIPFLLYWGAGNTPSERSRVQPPETEIDSFMTGLKITEYSTQGDILQQIQASHLEHRQGINYFTLPVLEQHSANGSQNRLEADRGQIDDGQQRMDLYDNVILQRRLSDGSRQQLYTEQLSWFPQQKLLHTRTDIIFNMPGHQIRAAGLKADLNTGRIDLLSGVKGLHNNDKQD
ncbi:MAG: LPS export ABC transporter periplasmic protein LptC [Marinobacterium sp.]|nr:LPS export ABC transporter periplasmic protein LptC [Marinobacterium sp.]